MGKTKRFYVAAFVIVKCNLSVTYSETEFWQGSVSVTFSFQLLCVADKYNDQCLDMLLFASVKLKIPPSRRMSGWNQAILPESPSSASTVWDECQGWGVGTRENISENQSFKNLQITSFPQRSVRLSQYSQWPGETTSEILKQAF